MLNVEITRKDNTIELNSISKSDLNLLIKIRTIKSIVILNDTEEE